MTELILPKLIDIVYQESGEWGFFLYEDDYDFCYDLVKNSVFSDLSKEQMWQIIGDDNCKGLKYLLDENAFAIFLSLARLYHEKGGEIIDFFAYEIDCQDCWANVLELRGGFFDVINDIVTGQKYDCANNRAINAVEKVVRFMIENCRDEDARGALDAYIARDVLTCCAHEGLKENIKKRLYAAEFGYDDEMMFKILFDDVNGRDQEELIAGDFVVLSGMMDFDKDALYDKIEERGRSFNFLNFVNVAFDKFFDDEEVFDAALRVVRGLHQDRRRENEGAVSYFLQKAKGSSFVKKIDFAEDYGVNFAKRKREECDNEGGKKRQREEGYWQGLVEDRGSDFGSAYK